MVRCPRHESTYTKLRALNLMILDLGARINATQAHTLASESVGVGVQPVGRRFRICRQQERLLFPSCGGGDSYMMVGAGQCCGREIVLLPIVEAKNFVVHCSKKDDDIKQFVRLVF